MEILCRYHLCGVPDTSLDILDLKVRIVILDDLGEGDALGHELEDVLNGDPAAGHAGPTGVDAGADLDTLSHYACTRNGWSPDAQDRLLSPRDTSKLRRSA